MISPVIQETPKALVEQGRINSGFFKLPFRRVNLLDAQLPGGLPGKLLRRLRLKEWIGIGIDHPQLYGAVFIQNSRFAASGTVHLYQKDRHLFTEWLVIDLPTRVKLPETLWSGESRCGSNGRSLHFTHDLEHCRHQVQVEIKGGPRKAALSIDLLLHQNWREIEPLVVSLPIEPDHHTYTHKSPMTVEGGIRIDGERYDFDPARDLANLDEQKTFYPYRSAWKWGCFATRSVAGRMLAVNFVNQMTPSGQQGEDAMWLDGRLMLLPQPVISALPESGAYSIEDSAGCLRLRFSALGSKKEKRNYGLIAMDYEQCFGRYDGEVTDADGGVHQIVAAFGALERMQARF